MPCNCSQVTSTCPLARLRGLRLRRTSSENEVQPGPNPEKGSTHSANPRARVVTGDTPPAPPRGNSGAASEDSSASDWTRNLQFFASVSIRPHEVVTAQRRGLSDQTDGNFSMAARDRCDTVEDASDEIPVAPEV